MGPTQGEGDLRLIPATPLPSPQLTSAAESQGLAGTGGSRLAAHVRTTVDGALIDVADVTTFHVNRYGAPTEVTNALGHRTQVYREDARFPALPTRVVHPNGSQATATYDAHAHLEASTDWSTQSGGRYATTTYAWDERWDEVASVTSPEGVTTHVGYDPANGNRIWQQVGPDPARRVDFGHNALGQVETVRSAAAAARGDQPQRYEYASPLRNLSATVSPLGTRATFAHDAVGRDTSVVTPVDGSRVRRDRSVLDVMGRVRLAETLSPPAGSSTPDTLRVETDYDGRGLPIRLTRRVLPDRNLLQPMKTSWRYDALGRRTVEVAVDGQTDSTVYNRAGLPSMYISRREDEFDELAITLRYDVLGRLVERITPSVTYRSESFSRLQRTWTFPSRPLDPDNAANPVRIRGDTATYEYDVMGNTIRADNHDALVRRGHNPNGTLAWEEQTIRSYTGSDTTSHRYRMDYGYDLAGRRTALWYPASLRPQGTGYAPAVQYGYHAGIGALETVADLSGGVFRFGYDNDGQLASLEMPGGMAQASAYDADGRLQHRTVSAAGTQAVTDTLVYDAGGKVSKVHSRTASVFGARYHGAGPLAFWHAGGLGAAEHRTIEMDAMGNPRLEHGFNGGNADQEHKSTFYREYGYVANGTGRLRYTVSYPSATRTSTVFEQTDDFDHSGNRYKSSVAERVWEGYNVQERTRLYYGADEKLRVVDRQRCFTYVDEHQQSAPVCVAWQQQMKKDPSAFEEYRYDALGRRVLVRRRLDPACQVECTSTIERFVWDGDDILAEIRAPGQDGTSAASLESDNSTGAQYGRVLYTHGMGIDAPLSLVRTGHAVGTFTVIPLANWRGIFDQGRFPDGTTQKCTTGGVCLNLSDLRWVARGAFFESLLGYHEKTWAGSLLESKQDASGQLYMRNRYFDPKMGRFTQEDPISFAGGLNLYGFGGGDPVGYSDPYGLAAEECCHESLDPKRDQVSNMYRAQNGREAAIGVGVGILAAVGGFAFAEVGGAVLTRLGFTAARAAPAGAAVGGAAFRNGERVQRFVETAQGQIEVMYRVNIQDRVLHLDRVSVFPKFAERVNAGNAGVRAGIRTLMGEARAQGFETLRITGSRVSGANPGRVQDMVIDLTR